MPEQNLKEKGSERKNSGGGVIVRDCRGGIRQKHNKDYRALGGGGYVCQVQKEKRTWGKIPRITWTANTWVARSQKEVRKVVKGIV